MLPCELLNWSSRHFCGKTSLTVPVSKYSGICYRSWTGKQSKSQKPCCSQNCSSPLTPGAQLLSVPTCTRRQSDSTNPLVLHTNNSPQRGSTESPADPSFRKFAQLGLELGPLPYRTHQNLIWGGKVESGGMERILSDSESLLWRPQGKLSFRLEKQCCFSQATHNLTGGHWQFSSSPCFPSSI